MNCGLVSPATEFLAPLCVLTAAPVIVLGAPDIELISVLTPVLVPDIVVPALLPDVGFFGGDFVVSVGMRVVESRIVESFV
jgi:hypothetical protein